MADKLQITSIKFYKPQKPMGSIMAICDIVLNEAIAIRDIRVIDGSKGVFVGFPQRKAGDRWRPIVFPINADVRKYATGLILGEFEKFKATEGNDDNSTVSSVKSSSSFNSDDDLPF